MFSENIASNAPSFSQDCGPMGWLFPALPLQPRLLEFVSRGTRARSEELMCENAFPSARDETTAALAGFMT